MTPKNIHSLKITAHARLHMGFFDLHGGLGRKFGSIGVALEWPVTEILATKLSENLEKTVANALHQNVDFKISQTIPSHAGLGSGTQLALAVGAAYNQLYDLGLSLEDIAVSTKRGLRSGIGIGTFEYGGVIVDGGRDVSLISDYTANHVKIPPILARVKFPEAWCILLILDDEHKGVHGEEELNAFKKLPVFPEYLADKLCRHVLMQALPALHECDLTAFGATISALQVATGDYFAPIQGGRYASQKVAQILDFLKSKDVSCLGQSSWGPTGFAVFENDLVANQMLTELPQNVCRYVLTKACNRPAEFKILK